MASVFYKSVCVCGVNPSLKYSIQVCCCRQWNAPHCLFPHILCCFFRCFTLVQRSPLFIIKKLDGCRIEFHLLCMSIIISLDEFNYKPFEAFSNIHNIMLSNFIMMNMRLAMWMWIGCVQAFICNVHSWRSRFVICFFFSNTIFGNKTEENGNKQWLMSRRERMGTGWHISRNEYVIRNTH